MLRHGPENLHTEPPADWVRPISKTPVLTLFFPHNHQDPNMLKRAKKMGISSLTDETHLVTTAKPLFPGHDQPKTYCIDHEGKITRWSDAKKSAIARQIEMAQEFGINGFIIDAYVERKGESDIACELRRPLNLIAEQVKGSNTQFCMMTSVKRPRIVLPSRQTIEKKGDITI